MVSDASEPILLGVYIILAIIYKFIIKPIFDIITFLFEFIVGNVVEITVFNIRHYFEYIFEKPLKIHHGQQKLVPFSELN